MGPVGPMEPHPEGHNSGRNEILPRAEEPSEGPQLDRPERARPGQLPGVLDNRRSVGAACGAAEAPVTPRPPSVTPYGRGGPRDETADHLGGVSCAGNRGGGRLRLALWAQDRADQAKWTYMKAYADVKWGAGLAVCNLDRARNEREQPRWQWHCVPASLDPRPKEK